MYNKKTTRSAFTFIEIIIASSILLTVLSIVYLIFNTWTSRGQQETKEQEFFRIYYGLENQIKRDLRSAIIFEVESSEPTIYFLRTADGLDDEGRPKYKDIRYHVNDEGRGVARFVFPPDEAIYTGYKQYNFADVVEEEPFVFEITKLEESSSP